MTIDKDTRVSFTAKNDHVTVNRISPENTHKLNLVTT